jgi:micrococcal nuclease
VQRSRKSGSMERSGLGGEMRFWGFVLVALVAVPGYAAPPCAGDIEISGARIMRIERSNDALVMTDGRALKLEGIRLPAGGRDRAPQAIADRAYGELEAMAKNQRLSVRAVAPKEDRYDRVRGQIFTADGAWIQLELLKRGLARVDLSPDRGECVSEFYAAEAEARRAGLGLWADPAYATRRPDQLGPETIGTFQIVVGRVTRANAVGGNIYLDFGQDWRRDFTVMIAADDLRNFRRQGIDPMRYEGRLLRVRGVVQRNNGPMIAIGSSPQIEVLP